MATKKKTKTYIKDGKTYSTTGSIPVGGTVTSFGDKSKDKEWGLSSPPTSNVETKVTTTPSSSSNFSGTNLKIGSTGDEVKALQQKLGVTVDGIFGPQTQAALKSYQQKSGLSADGIYGPLTAASFQSKTTQQPEAQPENQIQPQEDPNQVDTQALEQTMKPNPETTTPEDANTQQTDPATGEPQGQPGVQPIAPSLPSASYTIQQGDTLSGIASKYGTTVQALAAQNGISDPNKILAGKTIQIPQGGVAGGNVGSVQAGINASQNQVTPGEGTIDPETGEPTVTTFADNIKQVMKEFGIQPPNDLQSPQSSFSDIYKQVYDNLGLASIKKEFGLNDEIYDKVRKVIKYDSSKNQKDKMNFLSELPNKLRIELSQEMHDKVIQNLYFFRDQPKDFIAYVAPLLKPVKFTQGDYLYKTGDNLDESNEYLI
mgnify:CR=1 FL=1